MNYLQFEIQWRFYHGVAPTVNAMNAVEDHCGNFIFEFLAFGGCCGYCSDTGKKKLVQKLDQLADEANSVGANSRSLLDHDCVAARDHAEEAYEHQNELKEALSAVDEAINANKRIPDELYFAPRDLAIKAGVLGKLGQPDQADALYRESATIINSLLEDVPTPNVERLLRTEMGEAYAGYFVSMCNRHKYDAALDVLEEARGRGEAQALEHHEYRPPHAPTPAEKHLTELNIALLNAKDQGQRQELEGNRCATPATDSQLNLSGSRCLLAGVLTKANFP